MTAIKTKGWEKETVIKKGVRQDYSLSTLFFNLFIHYVSFMTWRKKVEQELKLVLKRQTLRFAGDIVLLPVEKKEFEEVLNCIDIIHTIVQEL